MEAVIVAVQAAAESGLTTPVVPRMEMPSMIPRRALRVFFASFFPFGTDIVTVIAGVIRGRLVPRLRLSSTASLTASSIIRLGTGLIAGSPTGRARPGLVTTPTPSPPLIVIVRGLPDSSIVTSARISALLVTSGSSPASFMVDAEACLIPSMSTRHSIERTANLTLEPSGKGISMLSGPACDTSANVAALAAAAAHAPVV